VTVRAATTPLPIGFAFKPEASQTVEPLELWQLMVFPAAVKAAPAAKLTPVTLAAG
jgi:hypothetical protein